MKRIGFLNEKIRIQFFEKIKDDKNFLGWKKIASHLETTRSMLDNYRRGKLLLPENRFSKLLLFIDKSNHDFFLRSTIEKEKNWGQVLGGKKAYVINKDSFDKGRILGYKSFIKFRQSSDCLKYNFDLNMPLTEELCEFIGVIIGDGCTNKYGRHYQTLIAGDKKLDNEYFNYLSSICEKFLAYCLKKSFVQEGFI